MDPPAARALSLSEALAVVTARAEVDPLLALGAALSGPSSGAPPGRPPLTPANVADRARRALERAGHTVPEP